MSRYGLLSSIGLALFAPPPPSWAASGNNGCSGPVLKEHSHPPFHFYTNSAVTTNTDALTSSQYPFVKTSCVVNAVPSLPTPSYPPTHVQWLGPDINGWLLDDSPLPSANKLEQRNGAQEINGCLEYGNQSEFTYAEFFGDGEDSKEVDHEKEVGCRQAAAEIASHIGVSKNIEEKLISIAQSVINNFPSFGKYAGETMLHLDGQAGITAQGDSYVSYFKYTLNPVPGSKGDPTAITLQPAFSGPAQSLIKDYKENNPTSIKGKNSTEVSFEVKDIKYPKLVYATYDFLDKDNQIVGSVDIPVFCGQE